METIAGPDLCRGQTIQDRQAAAVGTLAVDGKGGVYVDTGPRNAGRVRVVHPDRVDQLVTGVPRGEDPVGAKAPVGPNGPGRFTVDRAGQVVVAAGSKVFAVGEEGVTQVAGASPGAPAQAKSTSTGDGGPSSAARFADARSITTDEQGNLFVADKVDPASGALLIRFLNQSEQPISFYAGTAQELTVAPGHIDTVAGAPGPGAGGDGEPARSALIQGAPPALAVSGHRLYVATYLDRSGSTAPRARVRLINLGSGDLVAHGRTLPAAAIDTVAGGEGSGFGGDGGPARSSAFSYVSGIAADASGNLFIADQWHHRVRKVDPDGLMSTVAGIGDVGVNDGGFNGNGRPATETRLNRPYDVKVGLDGRVYISDTGNAQVRVVDQAGIMHGVPGDSPWWRCAPEGRGKGPDFAQPAKPYGVTVDGAGGVVFTDAQSGEVYRRGPGGAIRRLDFSSTASAAMGADGNLPLAKQSIRPAALVAVDGGVVGLDADDGRLAFLNTGTTARKLQTVTVRGRSAAVVGGSPPGAQVGQGTELLRQPRSAPRGGFVDLGSVAATKDSFFVADLRRHHVRRLRGGRTEVVAGEGGPTSLRDCCSRPVAVAVGPSGSLYVSDASTLQVSLVNLGNQPIRAHSRTVQPGRAEVVAGNGDFTVGADENVDATQIPLAGVGALAADGSGNLYVADLHDHSVRKVDARGLASTVVGTGRAGFNGDGHPGRLTSVNSPSALAIDPCGNLLVVDHGNDRVRRVRLGRSSCDAISPERGTADRAPSSRVLSVTAAMGLVSAGAIAMWTRHRHRPGPQSR